MGYTIEKDGCDNGYHVHGRDMPDLLRAVEKWFPGYTITNKASGEQVTAETAPMIKADAPWLREKR